MTDRQKKLVEIAIDFYNRQRDWAMVEYFKGMLLYTKQL